jgi:hypothetical protein
LHHVAPIFAPESLKKEEIMRGLGIILWGFVLMMLLTNSLVVPCVVYGIAVVVGLVIGIRKTIKENK